MAASMTKKSALKCSFNFSAYSVNKRLSKSSLLVTNLQQTQRFKSTDVKPSSSQYCLNLVEKQDRENYLCTLLYPGEYRTSAFALRALNIEMAQVQEITTDKMRAIMRLQFWKDAVENIFKGNPPHSPVAIEVAKAVEKHKLSKIWFTRILEARVKQIYEDPHTLKDVEDLGENTSAVLNYLLLESAGIKNVNADHAASHLGCCHSLVTLLRATPFHASRNKVHIPTQLLIKHDVSQQQILRMKDDQNVKDVMYDIASVAHQHLETAWSIRSDVPKEAHPILINSIIYAHFLKQLQLADFNVFDKRLHVRNHTLPWRLFKQKYFKRTY